MKSKLTLTVEEKLIERAKHHARERDTSVSDLVEKYFSLLEGEVALETKSKQGENSAFTRSLRGVAAESELDESDYRRHLEEKHQ